MPAKGTFKVNSFSESRRSHIHNVPMARDLEPSFKEAPEPSIGEPAVLTLKDGEHEKDVYVKVWDGKRVHLWKGIEWRVAHVKKSRWEPSPSAPLWWSFYGNR